ncbi:diaminopimelate epimerase [Vulgatibacter sp.]|uniref:diaminopimelate epimerase n=1 Tax=Vulgatibacter sp. TaxID=1971226 RepID=UPI0035648D3E
MQRLPFFKFHGLGNDFVVIDRRRAGVDITAAQAQAICDRHFGVGADGVLSLLPADDADFRMHIYNADGSEAEMCGNGIRCVAKHAFDAGLVSGDTVRIATGAGVLACSVQRGADGKVETVTVDMGGPELERERIPVAGSGRMVREAVRAGDRTFEITAVSMGNPHAVIFGEGIATVEFATSYGPLLERNGELFPRRTNVEFAQLRDGGIDVVVWERGCGITLACGTGACATAVAAVVNGLAKEGEEIPVRLPGGPLAITVEPGLGRVWMRGPAQLVFTGELSLY